MGSNPHQPEHVKRGELMPKRMVSTTATDHAIRLDPRNTNDPAGLGRDDIFGVEARTVGMPLPLFATATPTVTTDVDDYAPGSTAYITARGFRAGAEINFTIEVIDPETHAHLWTGPVWDVVDGSRLDGDHRADGTVLTQFYVTQDYADTTIRLTAVDRATGQTATWIFTDAVTANLNDWENGKAPSTPNEPGDWTNGNLNANKAHYAEGEAVPFESVFTGLAANTSYSITLTWDTTKAGLHAFDFLTSYNFDWTSNNPSGIEQTAFANPLIGTSLASLPTQPSISNPYAGGTTFGIPLDPNLPSGHNNLQGEASNQLFAIWGATITTVTTPSIS